VSREVVRADLLVLPFLLAAFVALTLLRTGARSALLSGGALVVAAAVVLAPWSAYATKRRGQLTPITSSSWSSLYVGTYLPGGGRMVGLRHALGDEARAHNPNLRHIPNANLRGEWVLDAVAARHPDVGRSEALKRETLRNLRRYALGRPLDFAAMQLSKLERMWIGYNRGTHHAERGWILAVHLLLSAAGLAGLLLGLMRTRDALLGAILLIVVSATAVNSFFVSEARHNVRLVPLLVAGGAIGLWLSARRCRAPAERSAPLRAGATPSPPPTGDRPPDAAAAR
jgi:hypothetical protein